MGWVPREHTTFVYDGDRLVETVTRKEPEWSKAERDLMVAFTLLEAETPSHGVPLSEATDPANQFAYRVPDPVVDFAAKALADHEAAFDKKYPDQNKNGYLWQVERRPTPTQLHSANPTSPLGGESHR